MSRECFYRRLRSPVKSISLRPPSAPHKAARSQRFLFLVYRRFSSGQCPRCTGRPLFPGSDLTGTKKHRRAEKPRNKNGRRWASQCAIQMPSRLLTFVPSFFAQTRNALLPLAPPRPKPEIHRGRDPPRLANRRGRDVTRGSLESRVTASPMQRAPELSRTRRESRTRLVRRSPRQ